MVGFTTPGRKYGGYLGPGEWRSNERTGGSLGRLQALGAAVQVKPGLAAAGPPLRQGARSEKQEEKRSKKKEEARRQKAYHGRRIPTNVTQKVYRLRVIVSGREKSGCMIRIYSWRVR